MSQLRVENRTITEIISVYDFISNTLENKIAKMVQSLFHSDFLTDTQSTDVDPWVQSFQLRNG